jgi:hypothetical protein
MEGEALALRFRARFANLAPLKFFWGTIDNVPGRGNEVELDVPTGSWTEASVDFEPQGFLANFGLEFGAGTAEMEFDWFRLYRKRGRNLQILKQWEFAETAS